MNNLIPVPRVLVEEILGNLPGDVDTAACGVIYESICALGNEVTEVPLTTAQVGELFKLAWADVDLDMTSAIEGTEPLEYAMAGNIESEERLRDLVQWAYGGVPKHFTLRPQNLLTTARHGAGCFLIRRRGTEPVIAQVTFHPASMIPKRAAYWYVTFTEAGFSEEEMREVSDILGTLNEQAEFGTEFRL